MIHSGVITLSYLPPIPPGLDRKVFQAELERVIAAEAGRLARRAAEALTASCSGNGASLSRDLKIAKTTPCTVENWASHHPKHKIW